MKEIWIKRTWKKNGVESGEQNAGYQWSQKAQAERQVKIDIEHMLSELNQKAADKVGIIEIEVKES